MASGKLTPALQLNVGTSFAAPRVAHQLAMVLRDLRALRIPATNALLRALLAASAQRPAGSELLGAAGDLALLGYGLPDGRAATDCSGSSVLLYWQDRLAPEMTAIFKFHVPAGIAESGRGTKRIVVAVASTPPVQRWGLAEYLGIAMKFRLFRGDENAEHIEALLQRDAEERNVAASQRRRG